MTDSESGHSLVQRALQSRFSKRAPRVAAKGVKLTLPRFLQILFDLRLRNEQEDVLQLQAGNTYTLAITGSLNHSQLHDEGITITKDIKLRLGCRLDVDASLKLDLDESFSLSYEDAAHFKEEFTINIPAHFPSCCLILELFYTLSGAYPERLERKVQIKGTYNFEDQQLLEASQIEAGLPEGVVILAINPDPHLVPAARETFRLRGWSHWGEQLQERAIPRAIVSLAEMLRRELEPDTIINSIRYFSGTISENLTSWLLALHKKYSDKLSIIIVDNTTLEIPWEMLEISQWQYLGAIARVVRWLPFRRFSHRYRLKVADGPLHTGPVIAYLDSNLGVEATQPEHEILQKLVAERCPSLKKLEHRMCQALEQVGLIYVGCHGQYGAILHTQARQKHSDHLRSINLEMIYQSDEPSMVVFINACESARIVQNNDLDPSSFVEGFLTHCASGYIGTLGEIEIGTAAGIASRILEAAMNAEGIQVAEILRCLRSEAVQQLQTALLFSDNEQEKRKQLYNVIDTFMYVYYGNPLARLHLLAANQKLLAMDKEVKEIEAPKEPDDGLHVQMPTANQERERA